LAQLTLVIAYTLTFETSSPVELDHTMRLCLLERKGTPGLSTRNLLETEYTFS
jgi:hypothetical protein